MSRYSDELEKTFPRISDVKKATKEILKKNGKLAFEELYSAQSLDRLKKEIIKCK